VELLVIPLFARSISSMPRNKSQPTPTDTTTSSDSNGTTSRNRLTLPLFAVGMACFMAFGSLGALDPIVAPHLQRTLGASPEIAGYVYAIPCVVFTVVTVLAPAINRFLSFKKVRKKRLQLLCTG